jgi:UDP-N-acetylmuramoylalanine--D-glutamate ligase
MVGTSNVVSQMPAYKFIEQMPAAVREAFEYAEPGDVVLLSPALSSFNLFRDYAARGEAFRQAVQKLARVLPR